MELDALLNPLSVHSSQSTNGFPVPTCWMYSRCIPAMAAASSPPASSRVLTRSRFHVAGVVRIVQRAQRSEEFVDTGVSQSTVAESSAGQREQVRIGDCWVIGPVAIAGQPREGRVLRFRNG